MVAQPVGPEPEATPAELEELISALQDETARQKLILQLRALTEARAAAAPPPVPNSLGATFLSDLADQVERVRAQLSETLQVLLDAPTAVVVVMEQAQDPAARLRWLSSLATLALVFGAGAFAQWLVARLVRHPRRVLQARQIGDIFTRVVLAVVGALLDIVGIAAFAAAAYLVLPLTEPPAATRVVALAVINAHVLVRFVMAVARMLFAPSGAPQRLFHMSDQTAHHLIVWTRRSSVVGVYGYFAAEAALLLDLAAGAHAMFAKAVVFAVALMLIAVVLQNRGQVAAWLCGKTDATVAGAFGSLRRLLGDLWHVLVILFIVATFGIWALEVEGGSRFLLRAAAMTVAVIVISNSLVGALHSALRRGIRVGENLETRFPGLQGRANRYAPALRGLVGAAIYLVAGLALLDAWGVSVFAWLTGEDGRFLTSRLATVLFIVLVAVIAWEVVSQLVERYLEERGAGGAAVECSARLRTLLPLMRNAIRIVLGGIVTLTILSELGLNIAPLLAGAGVIGLAIGFGAQSLVKDVITGTFILLEDAISVGDVVDVGGHAGLVESMTIRSVRLRDLSGNVHLVPFGEVSAVLNMTKGFSFAVIDVGVAYRENVDDVIEVLTTIGAEMQSDAEFGPLILDPLEVLGLDSFGDSAVNIRIRIKTRPIKQWTIKREFHRRMKSKFDEMGIEIPFPHQTIYFGIDKEGKAPQAHVMIDRVEQV